MKKFLSLLVIGLIAANISIFAQRPNKPQKKQNRTELTPEQRMDMNVKRMTKALMLNDSQTAKFTPLYINYLSAKKSLVTPKDKQDLNNLTDEQEIKMMKESFDKRRKMIDIDEKYFNDFSKFLTPQQLKTIFMSHKRGMRPNNKADMKKNFKNKANKGQKKQSDSTNDKI